MTAVTERRPPAVGLAAHVGAVLIGVARATLVSQRAYRRLRVVTDSAAAVAIGRATDKSAERKAAIDVTLSTTAP